MTRNPADELIVELDQQIGSVDQKLTMLKEELIALETKARQLRMLRTNILDYRNGTSHGSRGDEPSKEATGVNSSDAPTKRPRVDLIEEVLRESAIPLTIAEIRAPLRKKGYGIEMEDNIMYNSIYTAIRKWPDRFESTLFGWTTKDHSWLLSRGYQSEDNHNGE